MLRPEVVGVTIVVSFPTIALAWNVNAILGWLRPGTRSDSTEKSTYTERRSHAIAQLSDYLKRRQERQRSIDKNTLPVVENRSRGTSPL
ncbi:hypothetical protein F5Y11DRAFT_214439 [Daldinia sp. FL1419]|nr:hypothetical protein F5Y11DRAFT_214439 [Daldinia sp. FL1419]